METSLQTNKQTLATSAAMYFRVDYFLEIYGYFYLYVYVYDGGKGPGV